MGCGKDRSISWWPLAEIIRSRGIASSHKQRLGATAETERKTVQTLAQLSGSCYPHQRSSPRQLRSDSSQAFSCAMVQPVLQSATTRGQALEHLGAPNMDIRPTPGIREVGEASSSVSAIGNKITDKRLAWLASSTPARL